MTIREALDEVLRLLMATPQVHELRGGVMAKGVLNSATTLLDSGYDLDEDMDHLLDEWGDAGNVPDKKTHDMMSLYPSENKRVCVLIHTTGLDVSISINHRESPITTSALLTTKEAIMLSKALKTVAKHADRRS